MKGKILSILSAACCVLCAAGCSEDETIYTVDKKDFYYSFDNGATYGNERVELEVGKTILMKVLVTVNTNKTEAETITGTLTIPQITAIDAYYLRGQKITPEYDELNKLTHYPFTITTNEDWTFIFEFSPAAEARVQMSLDFDDPIPSIYDSLYTIKFVNEVTGSDEDKTEDKENSGNEESGETLSENK